MRDDGLWARRAGRVLRPQAGRPTTNTCKAKGYAGGNPWHDMPMPGSMPTGEIASGWLMKNADKPANIDDADSETPWLTTR